MTEIRPGLWQADLPNGVRCTFPSPHKQAADAYIADLLARLEKRNHKGIGDKIFASPIERK